MLSLSLSLRGEKGDRASEGAELHRKRQGKGHGARRAGAGDGDSMLYAQKMSVIIVHWGDDVRESIGIG